MRDGEVVGLRELESPTSSVSRCHSISGIYCCFCDLQPKIVIAKAQIRHKLRGNGSNSRAVACHDM